MQPDSYPPAGTYTLHLSDGRTITRPMSPDWVWEDTFGGAVIVNASDADGNLVWSK